MSLVIDGGAQVIQVIVGEWKERQSKRLSSLSSIVVGIFKGLKWKRKLSQRIRKLVGSVQSLVELDKMLSVPIFQYSSPSFLHLRPDINQMKINGSDEAKEIKVSTGVQHDDEAEVSEVVPINSFVNTHHDSRSDILSW
jgi:hypothetical protein